MIISPAQTSLNKICFPLLFISFLFRYCLQVLDNSMLVVSTGKDFVGFVKTKDQKQKEANDVVVGLQEKVEKEYATDSNTSRLIFRL